MNFSAPSTTRFVVHATGSTQFTVTSPLAFPAQGNQFLSLGRVNSGAYRMSGSTILSGTQHEFSAAVGNSMLEDKDQFWSLQLWADSNGNNSFDVADTFLTQQFGTSLTALNALPGEWITNSVLFESSSAPTVIGKQLILFLNNYGDSTSESYYDNLNLSFAPEPGRMLMLPSGLMALPFRRHRSRP